MEVDTFLLIYENFYLLFLTLAVIGYGDGRSMPDLVSYPEVYSTLTICMIFGFIIFQ